MPSSAAAVDTRSTHAATFPTLPEGMQRSQVEALLVEVASAIGLSGARLQALLVMIGYTRPQAWTDPGDEPVCYASQVELAAALGATERARARDRARAVTSPGLIEKRTAAERRPQPLRRLGPRVLPADRAGAAAPRASRPPCASERARPRRSCGSGVPTSGTCATAWPRCTRSGRTTRSSEPSATRCWRGRRAGRFAASRSTLWRRTSRGS
jgi:hypothetical protein